MAGSSSRYRKHPPHGDLRHVRPDLAALNERDDGLVYSELGAELTLEQALRVSADVRDIALGDFGAPVERACFWSASAARGAVARVVRMRPLLEMSGVAAESVVATVPDQEFGAEMAVSDCVGEPVRLALPVADLDPAVAFWSGLLYGQHSSGPRTVTLDQKRLTSSSLGLISAYMEMAG